MAPGVGSRGAVYERLAAHYKGEFRPVDGTVTVGTTIVEAAPYDPERVSLTMMNVGTTVIYVRPNAAPSTTAGIRLGPAGGGLTVSVEIDGDLPAQQWQAIGDAAAGSLYVLQSKREVRIPGEVSP